MTNLVKKVWWRTPNFITNSVVKYGEDTTRLFLKQQFSLSKNKVAFAKLCFGHHLKESSPIFHSELFTLLSQEGNTGVAAPRGFAKSTILMIDDVFDIANGYRHYIVKVSDSYTQSLEHTDTLQYELENNEVLRWIYGNLKTDTWSSGEFVTTTGVKVVAKGQGMKVRGLKFNQYRPDKINIDDLENDELVESPERRAKLKRWFKMGVIPAMAKGGKINIVGTILHHDALLAKIVNGTDEFSGWNVKKFKALNEINGEEVSLWPQMYSVDYLRGMRDDPKHPRYIGSITFSQEYQNEPMSDEDAVIKRTWIKYQDSPPAPRRKVIVIDPAISKKETADFTAIQCWQEGIDGNAYCLEKIKAKLSFTEQGNELKAMYDRQGGSQWETVILIEEVAYQQALKEHQALRSLPVMSITPIKDKRTRLIVVSKWFEAGNVYFRSSMEDLVDEVVNFGSMANDDQCFVAGTKIKTINGDVNIEKMKTGDYVLTRQGYKKVLRVMCNGKKTVINRLGLTGTPNHPIFTKQGLKRLECIVPSDIIYMWEGKLSSIMAKDITDILNQREDNYESIFGNMTVGKKHQLRYTDRFGLITLVKYLKDILFTIKMKILSIMKYLIYSLLVPQIIQKYTPIHQNSKLLQVETSKLRGNLQVSGTVVQKVGLGIVNMLRKHLKNVSLLCQHVLCVVSNAKHNNQGHGCIAEEIVVPNNGEKRNVYNLEVKDCHEYFANGILVHNCDASTYALNFLKGNPIDDKLISSGGHGIDDLEDYKNFEK